MRLNVTIFRPRKKGSPLLYIQVHFKLIPVQVENILRKQILVVACRETDNVNLILINTNISIKQKQ